MAHTVSNENLPSEGFMRIDEVLQVYPVSRATLWRKIKDNEFVQPVKLGPNITAFPRRRVYQFLDSIERGACL